MTQELSLGELYSTYFNDLFVLKTNVTISGQPAEIDFSENDLVLRCQDSPALSLSLTEVSAELCTLFRNYGVCQVIGVWSDAAPFIQITFPSVDDLKIFLDAKDRVEVDLESLFSKHLSQSAAEPRPQSIDMTVDLASQHLSQSATEPCCEVETEIFLVAPDAKQKDARVISVTGENCVECLSILNDSNVFQFGSLLQTRHPDKALSNDRLTLLELMSELATVVGWFHLGLFLGIPYHELLIIDNDKQSQVQQCKTAMLIWWLQHGTQLTWTSVTRALEGIKMEPLARKIATKYGVPLVTRDQQTTPIDKNFLVTTDEARRNLEDKEHTLISMDDSIRDQSRQRVSLRKRQHQEKDQLSESSRKIKKLKKGSDDMRWQLELKEQELHFFRQLEKYQSDNADLRVAIGRKEVEIEFLQKQLSKVENDLSLEKEKSEELRKRLHQTELELAKLCERLQGLEKGRAELERERGQIHAGMIAKLAEGAEPSAGIASTGQEEDMEEEEERGDKEVTDLRAKVEEAEDRRRKAEEELKIQSDLRAELEEAQDSRVTAMEELKVVTDLRVEVHELENRRLTAKLEEVQNRKMSAELELKILWSRLSGWKVHTMERIRQLCVVVDGKSFVIDPTAGSDDMKYMTVGQLKEQVKHKTGIPCISEQRLMFGNQDLEDDRLLGEYNMLDFSTLYVLGRLR